jgi:N12 class adenine-specific DNA methylase
VAAEVVSWAIAPYVLQNPEGGLEIREKYLSGNVRRKLEIVREAAKTDPTYSDIMSELQSEDH